MSAKVPLDSEFLQKMDEVWQELGKQGDEIAALQEQVRKLQAELHPKPSALYVPLFIYPGPNGLASWQKVADLKAANPKLRIVVTVNPNNGNFSAPDANFTKGCMILASAGVEMLGYVYTDYGLRPTADVEKCMNAYRAHYPMIKGGFFLDEMGKQPAYYANLKQRSAALGYPFVMGNPGTATTAEMVGTVDCILIYESPGLPGMQTLVARTFAGRYPKENFGAIPHTVANYNAEWVKSCMEMCGFVYVTQDGSDGNPWNSLSNYLDQLAKDLR